MDPNVQRGNTHAQKTGGWSRKKRYRGKPGKQTQAVITNGPTLRHPNNASQPVQATPKEKTPSTNSVQNGPQHPYGLRGKDIGMHYANKKKQHQNEVESLKQQLKELPPLSDEHNKALTSLIDQITTDHCLSEEDVNIRQHILEHVREVLRKVYTGLEARLYGSSMTEFGLISSDVNIDLEVPSSAAASFNIKDAVKILVAEGYTEVENKSSMAFECVSLHSPLTKLVCRISVGAKCPEYTSQYLKLYSSVDLRLKKLALTLRHWAQVCRLFEPDSITFPPHCLDLMVIFYLQRVTPPVLPVLSQDAHCSNSELVQRLQTNVKANPFRTENTTGVGRLWLEMLHFYSAVFDLNQFVICVHDKDTVTLKKHEWTTFMAVEDPFLHTNLIQKSHKRMVIYLNNCLMKSCRYFAYLSLPSSHPSKSNDVTASQNGAKLLCTQAPEEGDCSSSCDKCSTSVCDKDSCDLKPTAGSICDSDGGAEGEEKRSTNDEIEHKERPEFKFEGTYLADAMGPPKVCSRCERMGHTQSNCPVLKLTIDPLPDMDPAFLQLLSPVIENIPNDFALTEDEENGRELIRKHIENLIRQIDQGITVKLFGSSKNGFGFHHSDIDMCAVIGSQCEMSEKSIFRLMHKRLWQNQHLYSDIIHIKWARIPLLKFVHKLTGLACDLSVNNMLALHNTCLLETYCKIDPRVKMLGYAIKVFAKVCNIGDAAQGTLSSYTYTVMMLHYLQHTQPPVIPVLQQLPHTKMTEEGCNVGFFSNIPQLPRIWSDYGKNKQSVGDLWLGFFRYYLEEFDLDTQVVSIRQWEPINKADKLWHELCMAVEDPFIHDRNLSKRSFTMDRYIREVFVRGRHLYGTPMARIAPQYNTAADYFFDAEFLTNERQTKGKSKKKKDNSKDSSPSKKNVGEQSKPGKDVKETNHKEDK